MHRVQDTYPLSHFRQHTREHLERLSKGRIETITQNGEAAMVAMSPETYDLLMVALERGPIWDAAIDRYESGDRGEEAEEALSRIARRFETDR